LLESKPISNKLLKLEKLSIVVVTRETKFIIKASTKINFICTVHLTAVFMNMVSIKAQKSYFNFHYLEINANNHCRNFLSFHFYKPVLTTQETFRKTNIICLLFLKIPKIN
jgi:hypothetical protein